MSGRDLYERFERLFCGRWTCANDGITFFLRIMGMPIEMIDTNSRTHIVISREGRDITINATIGQGQTQVTINETMQLGIFRRVTIVEANPNMVINFAMGMDGDNLVINVVPIDPPSATYFVVTQRVEDRLQLTYKAIADVTGTQEFTRDDE